MTLLRSERVYSGRIVSLDVDTVRYPNGETGTLEMLRHPGASAVVPFLDDCRDDDPRILLIHQFRHATGGALWEIPAGRRDGTEAPDETARRELREETGYRCGRLVHLVSLWTTPGFTDERIQLYMAEQLEAGATSQEADEVLEVHQVRWSAAMAMIRQGEIADAKTLVALLWVEVNLRR